MAARQNNGLAKGNGPSSSSPSSATSDRNNIPDEFVPLRHRYALTPETLANLLMLPSQPSQRTLLEAASQAPELRRHSMLAEERAFFRAINGSKNVRWPVAAGSPVAAWQKAFLLVQMQLSGGEWPGKINKGRRRELVSEKKEIFKVLNRIVRCVIDVMGLKRDGVGVGNGLDILRALEAGVWDEERKEILQVAGIGPKLAEKLAQAGITTTKALARMESWNIERVLSRNPPFGVGMMAKMKQFPILGMKATQVGRMQEDDRMAVVKVTLSFENAEVPKWRALRVKVVFWAERKSDSRLVFFWRGGIQKLQDGKSTGIVFGCDIQAGDSMSCYFACEEIVGTMVRDVVGIS